jgi:spermidine synthase
MAVMSKTNKEAATDSSSRSSSNNDNKTLVTTATTNNSTKIRGIENGWFTETATMWPGQKFSLALKGMTMESILFHEKSQYQEILIFQSAQYGT